jgi:prepilin-type N-terminal cleavage/methylation domain-containing protein
MKLFPARTLQKGFTLIELLVVIGILGILAAALVATIDPFEQLKKADDAKIKNIAVEFQTANVRYYTTHGSFPWSDANSSNANCTAKGAAAFNLLLGAGGMIDCLGAASTNSSLIGEGELKAAFTSNLNDLNRIYANWDPTDATNMTVCFSPKSKSQKSASETKYDKTGATPIVGCPASTAPDDKCYWCTK